MQAEGIRPAFSFEGNISMKKTALILASSFVASFSFAEGVIEKVNGLHLKKWKYVKKSYPRAFRKFPKIIKKMPFGNFTHRFETAILNQLNSSYSYSYRFDSFRGPT